MVANGFALDAGDVAMYGLVDNGTVTTLALRQPQHGITKAIGPLLVDWCAARTVDL
jgi:hypothetical protein